MTQTLEMIRTYWSLGAATAAVVLFALWRHKSVEADGLKLDNQTKEIGGEIVELKQEASNAEKVSKDSGADYDSMLRANPELRKQLGLHDPDA